MNPAVSAAARPSALRPGGLPGDRAAAPQRHGRARHVAERVSMPAARVAEGHPQAPASADESLEDLPLPALSRGHPLFGDTFNTKNNFTVFTADRVEALGPVFRAKLWGSDCVFITGEANVRRLLQEETDLLHGAMAKSQVRLLGSNSFGLLEGARHTRLRRLTSPSFSMAALGTHIPEIQAVALEFFSEWAERPSVKFVEESKKFTFRIISSVVLGMDLSLGEDRLMSDFNSFVDGLFTRGINLGRLTKYGRGVRARERLLQAVDRGLQEIKRATEAGRGGTRGPKLLEKLWTFRDHETGDRLTEDEIRDSVLTLLLAGFITTASTLNEIVLELGSTPQVLARLREEQANVVAAHGPNMSLEALEAMPYAEACVKETLRVHPAVEIPPRKVAKEFEIEGCRVLAGWSAFVMIGYITQYEDSRWPGEQHNFNPDRWLTEEGRKSGAWIPFGMGPHICLGMNLSIMEAKIFLATLARGFDIYAENLRPEYRSPGMPKDGLPATITRHMMNGQC